MTEKFAIEVDAKNRFWKKCWMLRMFKGFPIIQESFMT